MNTERAGASIMAMSDPSEHEGYTNESMSWRDCIVPVGFVGLVVAAFWIGPSGFSILFALLWVGYAAFMVRTIIWRRKKVMDGQLERLPRYLSIVLGIRAVLIFIALGLYTCGYWLEYRGEAPAISENLRTFGFVLFLLSFVLEFGSASWSKRKQKQSS
ncbi:MAG: hypothetical protein REJ23_05085 [Brevundimonas sp.]|nr:hypothetical protein [Brevundimonas sp.]